MIWGCWEISRTVLWRIIALSSAQCDVELARKQPHCIRKFSAKGPWVVAWAARVWHPDCFARVCMCRATLRHAGLGLDSGKTCGLGGIFSCGCFFGQSSLLSMCFSQHVASFSLAVKMLVLLLVATDVVKSEQCYTPARRSLLRRATVLTDDVLIYGMQTKVSEALSSRSLSLRLPHNVSLPLGSSSYQGRSGWSVVCLPKAIQHIWLQLEIYAVGFFWPEMEIDCKI